jgi:hypothetical protein
MWHLAIRLRPAFLLGLVPLALLACGVSTGVNAPSTPTAGASATPSPTATPPPHASVIEVANVHHFADSKSGGTSSPCANGEPLINSDCGVTVTATCPSGDPALSGGWAVDDPLAFVTASYSSGASAWTVVAHDEGQDGQSHPVTVTAYADCLQANFTATTQIISLTIPAPSPHTATLSCPSGTVVMGGGYRGNAATASFPRASQPFHNNWQAVLWQQPSSSIKPTLFAVCATNHLSAASQPSAAHTFGLFANGTVSVACPAGQVLVGGGSAESGAGNVVTDAATSNDSHWRAQVEGPTPAAGPGATLIVTVYAVCVNVV